MSYWTIKTDTDGAAIQKDSEEIQRIFGNLKRQILEILATSPNGIISEGELLSKMPAETEAISLGIILGILQTEGSIVRLSQAG
jgi:hypothetical protein